MNSARVVTPSARPARPSRLLRALLRPDLFDFWASQLNPLWSLDRPLARLVARQQESRDSVSLLLQPNRHVTAPRPGQHLNLTAEVDGVRITRSYSPSDCNRRDGCIAITVKAVDGGKLSRHLVEHASLGSVFELGPAFGPMTLPESLDGEWLLLAAGSGITPLIALTRELAKRGMPVPLTLVYWAKTRADLCFVEELRALARQHNNFRLRLALTGERASAIDELDGRISGERLSALGLELQQQQVFACGPSGFVDAARAELDGHSRSFHAEAFTPAPAAVEDHGNVQVTLARSGQRLTLPRGTPLLGALEAAGVKPPSGCRMGICNTCACGKNAGSTRDIASGQLQHEPVSALRLCVSSAASDLILEL